MPELNVDTLFYLERVSVLFNLAFTLLIAYEIRAAWLCGFVGSVLGILLYGAYAMPGLTGLQVFFAIMGIYGYATWGKDDDDGAIKVKPLRQHLILILVGSILVVSLSIPLQAFLQGELPYHDSFIAIFSIAATFLMAWKWLNHWLYWAVIDSVWLYVNIKLDLDAYAILSALYILLSGYGYWKWRKELALQASP